MKSINFNGNWIFRLEYDQEGDRIVNLPHDFSIEGGMDEHSRGGSASGFFSTGNAQYIKKFVSDPAWLSEKKSIIVEFDGVYYNSTVNINGQPVAKHPYGYTGFLCDLTQFLLYGDGKENELSVEVNALPMPNSRWYPGCGIYRDVTLHVGETVFIAPWDVAISTPEIELLRAEGECPCCAAKKANAEIAAEITLTTYPWLREKLFEDVTVKAEIFDDKGNLVGNGVALETAPAGKFIATPDFIWPEDEKYIPVNKTYSTSIYVENADLWSPENPNLYTVKLTVIADGNEDKAEVKEIAYGIRKVEVDAENGFRLNGAARKMQGGCVHHDDGILGSAAFRRAEERKVQLLKDSGYDAIRTAHNPPSTAMLEACDRLGMLVMDEAFDCWNMGKNKFDYNVFFDKHWRDDMAAMVLRDRNHPSVIMWSIGNEINERSGSGQGYKLSRLLADYVRSIDSTRPVTMALCGFWDHENTLELLKERSAGNESIALGWDGVNCEQPTEDIKIEATGNTFTPADQIWGNLSEKFAEPLDIVGYNYMNWRYAADHLRWPDRIICGTETFPFRAFETWEDTLKNPHVIGDFVWTSLDYLGEAGIGHLWYKDSSTQNGFMGKYPWNQAYCGDISVTGTKRPQSYYRDCLWGIAEKPYIAVYRPKRYDVLDSQDNDVSPWSWHDVFPCWSWPGYEGAPIRVEVYSTDDEIELFLNGTSLGKQPAGKENQYIATFNITYTAGELKAVAYKDGKITAEAQLVTPSKPAMLRLTPDTDAVKADPIEGDLAYVKVELVDADGNLVSDSHEKITVHVQGPASLIALGSTNPKTDEGYTGNTRMLDFGEAMAVIRPNAACDSACSRDDKIITICASTESGVSGSCTIELK